MVISSDLEYEGLKAVRHFSFSDIHPPDTALMAFWLVYICVPRQLITLHIYSWSLWSIEFFLNCQISHFCHSCTKLTSRGFKISQKKKASTGYWTHNTNPTIRIPATLTPQPPRHLLNRRFMNWTWIISGLIEHDFIRVWKFETGMDWQIGRVGKVVGILIVGVVLWVQYPVEAIFFCLFWNPVMSILYKNDRNVRSGNLGKTRLRVMLYWNGSCSDEISTFFEKWNQQMNEKKTPVKCSGLNQKDSCQNW